MQTGRVFALENQCEEAVLAGLIGISLSRVHQLQQGADIPKTGTYREQLNNYCNYLRSKSRRKAGPISEITSARNAELIRANIQLKWLEIKEKRKELISSKDFAEAFSPMFLQIRDQLIAMGKRHLELRGEIYKLLEDLSIVGGRYCEVAEQETDEFIHTQLAELTDMEKKGKANETA